MIAGIIPDGTKKMGIYDFANGKLLATTPFWVRLSDPEDVDYAPNAGVLADASGDGITHELVLWHADTWRHDSIDSDRIKYVKHGCWSVSLTPDGKEVASTVPIREFVGPVETSRRTWTDRIREWIGVDPPSDKLAEVRIYDVSSGRLRKKLPGARGTYSPDGSVLAVDDLRKVRGPIAGFDEYARILALYDVPLRGPFLESFAFGLGAGVIAYLPGHLLRRRRAKV
jgi:hypothetical protein